jgi:hypothetical protein
LLKIRASFAALAAAASLAPLVAHAQITDEDMCRNGLFASQTEFRIATVGKNAQPRLYFMKDDDGCPQKGGDQCRAVGYVVPGDELLLGKTHGQWSCAWFNGKKHETVGWVDNTALAGEPQAAQVDWTGKWKQYNYPGYIDIASKGGAFYVLGEMIWQGLTTQHFGEMRGELKVNGNRAHLGGPQAQEKGECAADLTRIGRFLIVWDNEACGGVNVRFNGVYTRVR